MMYIAVLQFTMEIPYANSLKEKRSVVRSLKDRVRRRYNVSIAEVDDLDTWTAATLGATMVGSDVGYLNGAIDKLIATLETDRNSTLGDHQLEILNPK